MEATMENVQVDAVQIPRKVWTREEAHALVDLGFPGAERLELIEGELIDRMGKKRPHVIWQNLIQEWLEGVFGRRFVEAEAPTDVAKEDNSHSEPEPDIKVLRKPSREYLSNPNPEDILLAVEISDSTVRFDLTVKARLYARAGIVEYWVVNIRDSRIVVHREPAEGVYKSVVAYGADESVAPLAAPLSTFCLRQVGA